MIYDLRIKERFLGEYPIKAISIDNENYPALLKQIPDPPRVLYYRGKMQFCHALSLPKGEATCNCFAIIGTRKASDYGKEIAFSFAKQLTQAGLTIVSGMARGVDSFAHRGALEVTDPRAPSADGALGSVSCPTIAVLGTGLDEKSIYPQENLKLARQILEKGGCLISEYPAEAHGDKFTFLQRNRIIAGMCAGVLVVEAKIKSGALNTANWAKKQGRKIFAVPGSLHSPNSQGCHFLIKQGAKLAEKPEDILKELGVKPELTTRLRPADRRGFSGQGETEIAILNALKTGSHHIDKIIELTKLPPQKVSATISLMEIEGKVRNFGGNTYALTR